jgi:hypothetical protein
MTGAARDERFIDREPMGVVGGIDLALRTAIR